MNISARRVISIQCVRQTADQERRQLVPGQVREVGARVRVAVSAAVAVRGAAVLLAALARERGRARARRAAAHAHARARPARQRARTARVLCALRYLYRRVQHGYYALALALQRKYATVIIILQHT